MKRPCLDCGTLSPQNRCPIHRTQRNRAIEAKRGDAVQRGYASPEWRRARKAVIQLVPYCVDCGTEGTGTNPLTADHIRPKAKGGSDDLENLTTRCRRCNSAKGAR